MHYTETLTLVVALSLTLSLLYAFPTISCSLWQNIHERIESYKKTFGLNRAIPEDKKYIEIDVRGLH